jgi:hypothetical protein
LSFCTAHVREISPGFAGNLVKSGRSQPPR